MVDLVGPWNELIGAIPGGFLNFLAIIGVALIVVGFATWAWQRRRGGGSSSNFVWMTIIGIICAAPKLLIPGVLKLIEYIFEAIGKLASGV